MHACCRFSAIAIGSWLRIRLIRRSPSPASRPSSPAPARSKWLARCSTPLRPASTSAPTFISTRNCSSSRRPMRPALSRYRTQLAKLLKIAKTITLPHEQIIARLDQIAQVFRVLIIKTGADDSLHLNLFRTRLRLLERRGGTTVTASDGCCQQRSSEPQPDVSAQLRIASRPGCQTQRPSAHD